MQRLIIFCLLVVVLLFSITTTYAQDTDSLAAPQVDYVLSWDTIDSGGATLSSGGSFSLHGSIGQPDSGASTGGSYTLNGSLWGGALAGQDIIAFLPLVTRHAR